MDFLASFPGGAEDGLVVVAVVVVVSCGQVARQDSFLLRDNPDSHRNHTNNNVKSNMLQLGYLSRVLNRLKKI